jgi:hypothetical protein
VFFECLGVPPVPFKPIEQLVKLEVQDRIITDIPYPLPVFAIKNLFLGETVQLLFEQGVNTVFELDFLLFVQPIGAEQAP